jgi:CopG antitoxin of type II toxin-antitoxin system
LDPWGALVSLTSWADVSTTTVSFHGLWISNGPITDKSINLRLPEELYDAVRQRATHAGLPYQRFIRLALENAVATRR